MRHPEIKRAREDILDELLVLRSQGGEAAALELLARRWHPRILARAARLTGQPEIAADVAQEAWLAIVRGLGRLHDPSRFKGWLHRIVANKCADWIRGEQRRRRLDERVAREREGEPEAAPGPDGRDLRISRLRGALRALPEDRRTLLALFYLEGLSVREIAGALEVPPGTVKSRLFHAREHLRRALDGQQPTDDRSEP